MSFFAKFKKGNSLCPVAASLYGTCATAAGTAEKAVTLPECDVLVPGMSLSVKFTNSNTAANPTLNVNSLGAIPIYRYGITAAGNTVNTSWPAGAVVQFTYGVAVAGSGSTEATYGFYMSGAGGVSELTNAVRDLVYPVGSIYMSVNATSPATILGGTWERIKDTFLLSAGDTYTAGATGGSADAVLPSHSHDVDAVDTDSDALVAHSHKASTGTASNYTFVMSTGSLAVNGAAVKYTSSAQGNAMRVPTLSDTSEDHFAGKPTTGPSTGNPTHNHTVPAHTTESAGVSATGANLPPYLAVYVWKRTA